MQNLKESLKRLIRAKTRCLKCNKIKHNKCKRLYERIDKNKELQVVNHFEVFKKKRRFLEELDYISHDGLLPRGKFASKIHGYELLLTEFYYRGVFNQYPEEMLVAIIGCMVYEERRRDEFYVKNIAKKTRLHMVANEIAKMEHDWGFERTINFETKVSGLFHAWATGTKFPDLIEMTSISEGDVIHMLRRSIDCMRQFYGALSSQDKELKEKMRNCMELVDRDVVKVEL